MTPGARFDLDEVLYFGDPWHGLYRGAVVELPNSTTRALPGDAPTDGSSFAIKIPGQPAVTTSTADAAAGMTWLNYGLINGKNHCLYGRAMGEAAWILIDADNVPWRAVLSGSGGTMTITMDRFGLFDSPHVTHSASTSFTWPSGKLMSIDDIDSTGRQVAIVFYVSGAHGWREISQVWLLTLSGTADALTITAADMTPSPLVDDTSGDVPGDPDIDRRNWWTRDGSDIYGPFGSDNLGNPVGYYPPGATSFCYQPPARDHYFLRREDVIGATLHDDTFGLVKMVKYLEVLVVTTVDTGRLFEDGTQLVVGLGYRWFAPYHRTIEVDGYYRITINGNDTNTPVESSYEDWLFEGPGPTVVYGGWFVGPSNVVTPVTIGGHVEQTPYTGKAEFGFGGNPVIAYRLANRAYGLGASGNDDSVAFFVAGPISAAVSPGRSTDAGISCATVHPLSGVLVTDAAAVCWV